MARSTRRTQLAQVMPEIASVRVALAAGWSTWAPPKGDSARQHRPDYRMAIPPRLRGGGELLVGDVSRLPGWRAGPRSRPPVGRRADPAARDSPGCSEAA